MAVWRLDGQIEADGVLECLPEERLVRGADPHLCAVGQAFADLSMQPCPARIRLGQPLPDGERGGDASSRVAPLVGSRRPGDRKSTRLNSSHLVISYAV